MSIQSEIDRISSNVQTTLSTIAATGVSVGTTSDDLQAAAVELANRKVSLPVDSDGEPEYGTAGAYAVSDGSGGVTWERRFDPTQYGLPVLYLNGDTSEMTKQNPVELQYKYGDLSGTATVKWQGASSLAYPKKNYTVKFDQKFEAQTGWGEQKKYCLKANYIDHTHARNIVSAKLWGEMVKSRTHEQDTMNIRKITGTSNGYGTASSGLISISDGVLTNNATMYQQGQVTLTGATFRAGKYYVTFEFYNPNSTTTDPDGTVHIGFIVPNSDGGNLVTYTRVAFSERQQWVSWSGIFDITEDGAMLELQAVGSASLSTPGYQFRNLYVAPVDEDGGVEMFDIDKCTGYINMSTGAVISGTAPVDGVIPTNNRSVYGAGNLPLGGQTFPKGLYRISADVYVTSSQASEAVYLGMCNTDRTTHDVRYVIPGSWEHVEMLQTAYVDDSYAQVQIGGGSHAPKIQTKNISVKKLYGDNGFDAKTVTGFVNAEGATVGDNTISGDNFIINKSMYNSGASAAVGPTFGKGTYKISCNVWSQRSDNTDFLEFYIGFANPTTHEAVQTTRTLTATQNWEYFEEIELENTVDDAYLFLTPVGGASCTFNASMQFRFTSIVVDGGPFVPTPSDEMNIERLDELPNGGAIDGFPCVLMINNAFHGLYTFNIPKDEWMFDMGDGANEAIIQANVHCNATNFKTEATLTDADFTVEYAPDEEDTEWIKTSLNTLIDACINSDGTDLDTTVAQYLDWQTAIDYHILVSVLSGGDMTNKNYLLGTYDGVKWFFSCYDMDTTYGLSWDGKTIYAATTQNLFHNYGHRVMQLIRTYKWDELKARYQQLRQTVWSEDHLAVTLQNFMGQVPRTVYLADAEKWPGIPNTEVVNAAQILNWFRMRVKVLDEEMGIT